MSEGTIDWVKTVLSTVENVLDDSSQENLSYISDNHEPNGRNILNCHSSSHRRIRRSSSTGQLMNKIRMMQVRDDSDDDDTVSLNHEYMNLKMSLVHPDFRSSPQHLNHYHSYHNTDRCASTLDGLRQTSDERRMMMVKFGSFDSFESLAIDILKPHDQQNHDSNNSPSESRTTSGYDSNHYSSPPVSRNNHNGHQDISFPSVDSISFGEPQDELTTLCIKIRDNPEDPYLRYKRAIQYYQRNQFEDALYDLDILLDGGISKEMEAEDVASAHEGRGRCLLSKNMFEEAEKSFKDAIETSQKNILIIRAVRELLVKCRESALLKRGADPLVALSIAASTSSVCEALDTFRLERIASSVPILDDVKPNQIMVTGPPKPPVEPVIKRSFPSSDMRPTSAPPSDANITYADRLKMSQKGNQKQQPKLTRIGTLRSGSFSDQSTIRNYIEDDENVFDDHQRDMSSPVSQDFGYRDNPKYMGGDGPQDMVTSNGYDDTDDSRESYAKISMKRPKSYSVSSMSSTTSGSVVKKSCPQKDLSHLIPVPKNYYGLTGVHVSNINMNFDKSEAEELFSKFGKVHKILFEFSDVKEQKASADDHKKYKHVSVIYSDPSSPAQAIHALFTGSVKTDRIKVTGPKAKKLSYRFCPGLHQHENQMKRNQERIHKCSKIRYLDDECYFWRTTGCNSKLVSGCKGVHYEICRGIDFQPYMYNNSSVGPHVRKSSKSSFKGTSVKKSQNVTSPVRILQKTAVTTSN